MRTQQTRPPNASSPLGCCVGHGVCLTLVCLALWLVLGWKWALLYYVLCLAYGFWVLVGDAPELRQLLAECLRRGKVRHV